MRGSAFPLPYWPKSNHAARGFVSHLPLLLPRLMGLMKGYYDPISCDFLEEILVLAQRTAAQNESSPCPLLQDPEAQSTGRESKALLGLGSVKLLSLTVLRAIQLMFSPIAFSSVY